jgi:hypothetical protein
MKNAAAQVADAAIKRGDLLAQRVRCGQHARRTPLVTAGDQPP